MASISWKSAANGDWSAASDWNPASVPDGTSDVTIGASGGGYIVTVASAEAAHSVTLGSASATLDLSSNLALGGKFALNAGTLLLDSGGAITGGTIVAAGGALVAANGALDGVTYQGVLDLSADGDRVSIVGGITLEGSGGSGPGSINLTGASAYMFVIDTETLNNATLSIGSAGGTSYLDANGPSGTTITLGSKFVVQHTGINAQFNPSGSANQSIVNQGSINAGLSGGAFFIQGLADFTNQGTIAVSNGDQLVIQNGSFVNSGTLSVTTGGTVTLGPGWSNSGKITETNASLNLEGSFTTAQLNTVTRSGGTVTLLGASVDNSNATLDVGTGSALGTLFNQGVIVGGIVHDGGGGLVPQNGALEGVTYQGTVLDNASGDELSLVDSITLEGAGGSGPGSIDLTGSGVRLLVDSTMTLDNATMSIGSAGGSSLAVNEPPGTTVTLGRKFIVQQTGANALFDNSGSPDKTIVNLGSINAGLSGGVFTIVGLDDFTNQGTIGVSNGDQFVMQAGSFVNSGTLSVTTGGTVTLGPGWSNSGKITETNASLNLEGSFTTAQLNTVARSGGTVTLLGASVDNSNAALDVGTGSALGTLLNQGVIVGGIVHDGGGGLVPQNGALEGVTYQGTVLDNASGDELSLVDSITLEGAGGSGPGSIDLTGSGVRLLVDSTMTLDNATMSIGSAGGSSLAVNEPPGTTVTLGRKFIVQQTGANALFDNSGSPDKTIVNLGSINAGLSGGVFTIVGLDDFTNQGTIGVSNDDQMVIQTGSFTNSGTLSATSGGTVDISAGGLTNLSGTTLTGGIFVVDAGSTLQLPNNATVTALAADLTVSGTASVVQSLNTGGNTQTPIESTLATIAAGGALRVLGGRGWSAGNTIATAGLLQLGGGTFAAPGVTIVSGGHLLGFGKFAENLFNQGTVEAQGGLLQLQSVGGVAGTLEIDAAATLEIAAAAENVTFNGAGATLKLDTPASYTGTLDPLAASDTIELAGVNGTLAAISGGTLTVSISGGGADHFAVSGSFGAVREAVTHDATGDTFVVLYRDGAPSTHTPEPVTFANQHIGGTLSQALTISNTATTDGYSENLDASMTGATAGIVASGTIHLLAPAKTNTTALQVEVNTTTAGAKSGTATIALFTDGTTVDGLGTLALASQTVHVSGNVYRLAAAGAHSPEPAGLGNVHLGGTLAEALSIGNTATADGFSENLDASIGSATAGITASGSFSGLLPGTIDSTDLTVGLNTGTAGAKSGTAIITLTSDGAGVDGLGTTALATQTVDVSGAVYRLAASTLAPEPVALGNEHVGGTLTHALSIGNTATTDGFSENLDANIGGATSGIAAAGSFAGLLPGALDSTHLTVGLNTSTAGAKSGTAIITLTSDGAGVDGLGTTALGTQTVDVSGAVYAYAAPNFGATTLDLDARVGATSPSGTLSLGDGTAANAYQEKLIYQLGTIAHFQLTNAAGTIASGGTTGIGVSLATTNAGNFSGSSTVAALTSTGAGTSGLANTALPGETLTLNGEVFATATAMLSGSTVNFGVVHTGQVVNLVTIGVTNTVTGALTDLLTAGTNSESGGYAGAVTDALGSGLAAGARGSVTFGLTTTSAGVQSGTVDLGFISHDTTLTDLALAALPVTVTGTVDNYATATIKMLSGQTISGSGAAEVINIGTVQQNSGTVALTLEVQNSATALADALGGSFIVAGAAGFTNTGFAGFSNIAAGQATGTDTITLATVNSGTISETVTLDPTSSNISSSTTLAAETLTITGFVTSVLDWKSAVSADWGVAADWSPTGPANAATIDAVIGVAGSYTVTIAATESFLVDSLLFAPATGGGTLALNGTLNLGGARASMKESAGTVDLAGTIAGGAVTLGAGLLNMTGNGAITGALQINGGIVDARGGATLRLAGAVMWNSGADVLGPGTLATTGTVTVNGAEIDGGLVWLNSGTVRDSGAINNDAIFSSSSATNSVTNQAGGTFDILSDGFSVFASGGAAPSAFVNAGLLEKTGGTGVVVFDATLGSAGTVTATTGTLELDAGGTLDGTVGGSGTGLVQLGDGATAVGFVTNSSLVVPDAGSRTAASLAGGLTWTDSGAINDGGRLVLGGATGTADIIIAAGGTLDFTSDDGGILSGGSYLLSNAGLIAKTGGTGTSVIGVGFTNTGTVDVASGTLKLGGGVAGSGRLQVEAAGTLELHSGAVAGNNTIALGGAGATLKIDTNSTFIKPIIGLGAGSRIDLSAASSVTTAVNGNTLVVTPAGGSALNFVSSSSLAGLVVTTGGDGGAGTVVSLANPTYTLTPAPTTIAAVTGNDLFIASNGALNGRDNITGGPGGPNTLELSGGGVFDLTAPKTLANIQLVDASEGQAAYTNGGTTVANTSQVIFLRDGLNVTLDVAGATPSAANPNPETITIYGGADSDVINLGAGSDTVVLGSAAETVNAGGGTALVQATATLAGAQVNGAASGQTVLEITNGGTATLNPSTNHATVKLDQPTNLMLSTMGFITAIGEVAGSSITAAATNQTLESTGGADTLTSYGGFGDVFLGPSAGLNGDTIAGFGGAGSFADKIDVTDLAPSATLDYSGSATQGTLTLNDGIHHAGITMLGNFSPGGFQIVTDGHTGSFITYG